ncbi:hypothetical protein CcCBS67573_g09371 [Chytriomyces confervae]|uniref:Uncharacterized protein n=1 Tax=Chytriomyces confervae TaxID=246404 RepID=A0A507DX31_9FUNG|nr:hypothetical protein CcCBS67573_g09371 [Chytriomyces confervae]
MTGAIPREFGNLVNLKNLNLSHPLLDGMIPDSFANLEVLDISSAMLTGAIPGSLGHLINLVELRLEQNHLSGKLPDIFGGMTKLHVLNATTSYMEKFRTLCYALLLLDLGHNSFCGKIPNSVKCLQRLLKLDLSHNQLSGEIPVGVAMLPALMDLSLNNNNLVGPLHRGIGALRRLINLDVSHNQLTGTVPKRVLKLRSNTRKLDHNQILGLLRVWMRGINSQEIAAVDQGVPDRAARMPQGPRPGLNPLAPEFVPASARGHNQVAAACRLIEQASIKVAMLPKLKPVAIAEKKKPQCNDTEKSKIDAVDLTVKSLRARLSQGLNVYASQFYPSQQPPFFFRKPATPFAQENAEAASDPFNIQLTNLNVCRILDQRTKWRNPTAAWKNALTNAYGMSTRAALLPLLSTCLGSEGSLLDNQRDQNTENTATAHPVNILGTRFHMVLAKVLCQLVASRFATLGVVSIFAGAVITRFIVEANLNVASIVLAVVKYRRPAATHRKQLGVPIQLMASRYCCVHRSPNDMFTRAL